MLEEAAPELGVLRTAIWTLRVLLLAVALLALGQCMYQNRADRDARLYGPSAMDSGPR